MSVKVKVNTIVLDEIIKQLGKSYDLTVGVRGGGDIVDIAIYNEYGTPHIPARPFLRTAEQKHHDRWLNVLATEIYKTLDPEKALHKLGGIAVGDVKKSIKSGGWKPNAKVTADRKGFNKPLIDTGEMLRAIDYEVIKK